MADKDANVEVKFRLYDGSDIGPSKYAPSVTIGSLKDKIIAEWPPDKKIAPKTTNDLKLIYAGKILENNKTLGDSRVPFGELPGGVITMHVVVPPSLPRKKTEKNLQELPKKTGCSCTIM
ncbi:membrane-anchored ubiquitin-fold protein 3-like [Aristolochia californica]|uniref:membrane-anchored ubiquitin-fold protein 3-like n=1 Tax=Aristolochia californica TaxID=171875 RepID=UPI0035D68913